MSLFVHFVSSFLHSQWSFFTNLLSMCISQISPRAINFFSCFSLLISFIPLIFSLFSSSRLTASCSCYTISHTKIPINKCLWKLSDFFTFLRSALIDFQRYNEVCNSPINKTTAVVCEEKNSCLGRNKRAVDVWGGI